ncbi:nitrile hydratase accessory protein [Phyllobacterium sp. YR531]|uniref:nitrile hydratase accessory protein n=1 Tax=Phyllobacterium sp. YR531 TaxID=1144343 RepID=UPI00026F8FB9|nr:nitrile hydratase accessory protein [Phyllobacterium sp. YR531]EJN04039.1 nitrile hydratase accessory protein [Phyllobacterium sp. YR531]
MNLHDPVDAPAGSATETPVFAEPWQAEAFAMVVALHERKLFTWSEWAQALSSEIKKAETRGEASNYYQCWLAALESLITGMNIAPKSDIDLLTRAWQRAALATPHGQPIRLENDPDRL